jgi:hypothetical protein
MESHVPPIMKHMIEVGEMMGLSQLGLAFSDQEICGQKLDLIPKQLYITLSLGKTSSAPLRGVEKLLDPSLIWTMWHLPTFVAPTFRCPQGLPFGAQFVSRPWNDHLLLQGIEELFDREILPAGSQEIGMGYLS